MARKEKDQTEKAMRQLVRGIRHIPAIDLAPLSTARGLVLGSTLDGTILIDLASRALVRWRIDWGDGALPDLRSFDIVEAELSGDLARDDLAQPESVTVEGLPRRLGSFRGRRARQWLESLTTPGDGPLFGFRGPSAPYWEFRGERPSIALINPDQGPQLLYRPEDGSTWVRFGWTGDDVWLLCEDQHAIRAIEATRRTSLSGKDLAVALGFRPSYVLATLSTPLDGHCYKSCAGLLPRG